jgi:hypothetical protein
VLPPGPCGDRRRLRRRPDRAPWAADFSDARLLTGICAGAGAAVLLLGFQTDYEPAAVRIVPMRVHLLVDLVVACFLIGTAVGVAALTDPGPLVERPQDGRMRHDDARGVLQ